MDYMDKVSKRIVELREEKGETQQELADAIGITRQSLSRYEIAARTINVDVLGALARHFEVSADYLLGLSDVKSTEQDMKVACEVTGLTEKAIENIKISFRNVPPDVARFMSFHLELLEFSQKENDEKESDTILDILHEVDPIAKKIIIDFLESDEFVSILVNIVSAVISNKEQHAEADKTLNEYKLNHIKEFADGYKALTERLHNKHKLNLLEIYDTSSQFVEEYDGAWILEAIEKENMEYQQEVTDNAQHHETQE